MLFNSEDVKLSNEESGKSSPIWSNSAKIFERFRRLWFKVPHKERNHQEA
jgi:hypothetical protein